MNNLKVIALGLVLSLAMSVYLPPIKNDVNSGVNMHWREVK